VSATEFTWQVLNAPTKPIHVLVSSINLNDGEQHAFVKAVKDALAELTENAKINPEINDILEKFGNTDFTQDAPAPIIVDVTFPNKEGLSTKAKPDFTAHVPAQALNLAVQMHVLSQIANAEELVKLESYWNKKHKLEKAAAEETLEKFAFRAFVQKTILEEQEMHQMNITNAETMLAYQPVISTGVEHDGQSSPHFLPDEQTPKGKVLKLSEPEDMTTAQGKQHFKDYIEYANEHSVPASNALTGNIGEGDRAGFSNKDMLESRKNLGVDAASEGHTMHADRHQQAHDHQQHAQWHHQNARPKVDHIQHSSEAGVGAIDKRPMTSPINPLEIGTNKPPEQGSPEYEQYQRAKERIERKEDERLQKALEKQPLDIWQVKEKFPFGITANNSTNKLQSNPERKGQQEMSTTNSLDIDNKWQDKNASLNYSIDKKVEWSKSERREERRTNISYSENRPDYVVRIEESKRESVETQFMPGERGTQARVVQTFEGQLTHLQNKTKPPFKPEVAVESLPETEKNQAKANYREAVNRLEKEELQNIMKTMEEKNLPKSTLLLDDQLKVLNGHFEKGHTKDERAALLDFVVKKVNNAEHPHSVMFDNSDTKSANNANQKTDIELQK